MMPWQSAPCDPGCLKRMKPQFTTVWYQASVNVTGKHLSGLLLFKKMENGTTRVIFTNEPGVTFFDFEYGDPEFRVVSILPKMNRKPVVRRLRGDIGLLIMHSVTGKEVVCMKDKMEYRYRVDLFGEQAYFITDENCSSLQGIETMDGNKQKVTVHLTGTSHGMPDSVYLRHHAFEYNISLKKLNR
jgi:hypothetical protein